jgi:hypothetical protein
VQVCFHSRFSFRLRAHFPMSPELSCTFHFSIYSYVHRSKEKPFFFYNTHLSTFIINLYAPASRLHINVPVLLLLASRYLVKSLTFISRACLHI